MLKICIWSNGLYCIILCSVEYESDVGYEPEEEKREGGEEGLPKKLLILIPPASIFILNTVKAVVLNPDPNSNGP